MGLNELVRRRGVPEMYWIDKKSKMLFTSPLLEGVLRHATLPPNSLPNRASALHTPGRLR